MKQYFHPLLGLLVEFPFCSIASLKLCLPRVAGNGDLVLDAQPVVGRTKGDGMEIIDPSAVPVDVVNVWFAADVHLV